MVGWTCSENKNNLPRISIYFSFSLAELCIAVRFFFPFSNSYDTQSSDQGANFVLCYSKRSCCCCARGTFATFLFLKFSSDSAT